MKKIALLSLFFLPLIACSQKNLTVTESATLTNATKKLQIVDVRTPHEFDSVAIVNAINIDVNNQNFEKNISSLSKETPILLYCRSGKRSLRAMNIMLSQGFKDVYNMEGGITAFSKDYPDKVIFKNK